MGYILGVNTSHNGSVALLDDATAELLFYAEEERYTHIKRANRPFKVLNKIISEVGDNITAVATSSCGNIDAFGNGLNYVFDLLRSYNIPENIKNLYDFALAHHTCHAYGGMYSSPFEDALIVVTDGAGSKIPLPDNNLLYEFYTGYYIDINHKVHVVSKDIGVETNRKLLYDLDNIKNGDLGPAVQQFVYANALSNADIHLNQYPGIVKVYEAVSLLTGNRPDDAGKIMGLSSYADDYFNDKQFRLLLETPDGELIPNMNVLINDWPTTCWINTEVVKLLQLEGHWFGKDFRFDKDTSQFISYAKLANEVQTLSCTQMINLIQRTIDNAPTDCKNIVISGGYGLNSICNTTIAEYFEDYNIFPFPIAHDGGTSIGAAYMAYLQLKKNQSIRKSTEFSLYLGENYEVPDLSSICASYNLQVDEYDPNIVAQSIADGLVIALYQGRSEGGPRALGNRSILFDPRMSDGNSKINEIKHRERYRPFAGTILEEHFRDWFVIPKNINRSPYMTFVFSLNQDHIDDIPAITHVDNTCRIQTLCELQNPKYYELIKSFYKLTNIPIIGNTSFNLAGEPLVETVLDALNTFLNSSIDELIIENSIVRKS